MRALLDEAVAEDAKAEFLTRWPERRDGREIARLLWSCGRVQSIRRSIRAIRELC